VYYALCVCLFDSVKIQLCFIASACFRIDIKVNINITSTSTNSADAHHLCGPVYIIINLKYKDVLTTSVNSRRPSVHKRLVTPLFCNGFSVITSLFFVVNRKE